MTKVGYTHILAIIDRSGSTEKIKDDLEGGFNAYVHDRAEEPGECRFTVVQFDDEYEVVHEDLPAGEVPPFRLTPRGWTRLYDAVGKACTMLGIKLAEQPEDQRPDRVIVLILTDGKENDSKEYSVDAIRQLIEQQTGTYSWKFTYLAADEKAILAAAKMGIGGSSTLRYAQTGRGVTTALAAASSATRTYRGGDSFAYDQAARDAAVDPKDAA